MESTIYIVIFSDLLTKIKKHTKVGVAGEATTFFVLPGVLAADLGGGGGGGGGGGVVFFSPSFPFSSSF